MIYFRVFLFFLLTMFSTAAITAQTQGGTGILLSKARSLEARGRMDLAAQNWKQVLLVNPNQTEALGGLARYAKQNGEADQERSYLERLRKINPKDPQIPAIEKMHVLTPQERDRLDEAGRLAMQHKPDEAMKIYNEVLGGEPPQGKWAEPYYETEAASTGGREKAIAQLRRLSSRDNSNEMYRLWLGRVLVYDPKTRMEGLQLLASLHDPGAVEEARTQWRQALLWEKENPAVLSSLDAYLQRYPDQELQPIQKSLQEKQAHLEEEASKVRGFQALRGRDMSTAEAEFADVLRRSPNDANAVAGMAFVRLNQKRFDEAVAFFERARTLAPKRADVREGYETAKFWSLIQQGGRALQQGQSESAITAYQQALALHPGGEQAMLGIAQAEVHENRVPDAEAQFQQVMNLSPDNADAIAGLAFIRLDQKRFYDAASLFDKARRLVPNRADLEQGYRNARFWSLMQQGAAAMEQNRPEMAITDYREALTLKPGATDALQGLAGAAERKRDYAQAAEAYGQLTASTPADTANWLGLLRVQIAAKNPSAALETAQRIPAATRTQVESRSDYLSEMAFLYYATNQQAEGDRLLRQAMDAAFQRDTVEAANTRLEVASALMQEGRTDKAVEIYRQTTRLHPDNAAAWEGLVGAYSRMQNLAEVKSTVRSMPQAVYQAASKKSGFLDSVAAVYSADGDCAQAEDMLNRSIDLEKSAGREPSLDTQLQLADIWTRQENYDKARQGFYEVISRNPNSTDAWRGYINTLHQIKDDRRLLAESKRMPATVSSELENDPNFLVVLASAHSKLGQDAQTVELLQQARSGYRAQGRVPSPDLDLELAWAMLGDRDRDPRELLQTIRVRTDLSPKQRESIDEIWSTWSIHQAEQALQNKKREQAIVVLIEAQRDLPSNPKIYAELASIYIKQHNFQKALATYETWGLAGAEAGDYRAAAGSAVAAHKTELANLYLEQGLRQYPGDPELLRMKGKQAAARGNYGQAEDYLKSALVAARNPRTRNSEESPAPSVAQRETAPPSTLTADSSRVLNSAAQMPACRKSTSFKMSDDYHFKLVSSSQQDQENQSQPAPNHPATQNNNEPTDGANPQSNPKTQEEIQDEIDVVQNRNTPFIQLGSVVSGRGGDPGIDRLIIEDGTIGGSAVANDRVRVDLEARGIYLYSGTPDGRSKSLFGTLPSGATFGQQATGGITGEFQLSTGTFGLYFTATPQSFPVQNLLGGLRFRPLGGPFTFTAIRDSVKDSLLSYAGVRDPGSGITWGGVVSNTGILQLEHKTRRAGQYASVSFSYLTGQNVPNNWGASGNAGFYFVVAKGLSVGLSVSGMHYDKNLSFFSLGQGGYFSPQQYGLGAIPISWFSRHQRFEYELRASLGAQYISQDRSSFFPTRLNTTPPNLGFYASSTSTGPNYNFLARLGYRLTPNLYFDVFGTGNNARNYASQSLGFSLKFLVHRLPTNTDLHVNSVPDWKGNQPFGIE